ncbi:MAG: VCBS repeat-containing protein [Candidatus Solibacter usitatus]|nr:VCBS repeat-containing protein [Candidatus Solibacter usitatus]
MSSFRYRRYFLPFLLSTISAFPAGIPQFRQVVVSSGLKMGYQLVAVDLNNDGRKDLIVIDERSTELAWFENPGWQRHVLAANVPRAINLDCWDYDGDGVPEIAMAHNFETNPEKSAGNVLILKAGPDVRAPWNAREIDRIPTAHRLRWIDPRGDGRKLLLVAPLVGPAARPPDYAGTAPIYAYRPGQWKRELITSAPRGVLHSIAPVAWGGRGQRLFTASFSGLELFTPHPSGPWTGALIAPGDPRPCPECGSSEVKTGKLGRHRFIAAIEPWHGNQVVVYLESGKKWTRVVLDDTMLNGHALAVGDLDGDGRDEIVSGFRGKGFRLSVFQAEDKQGERWRRTVIDPDGIAAADCKIDDFDNDGKADIACSGASTGNVKLYLNLGPRR